MARSAWSPAATAAEQIAAAVAESVAAVVDAYVAYRASGGAEEATVLFDRLTVLETMWPPRARRVGDGRWRDG